MVVTGYCGFVAAGRPGGVFVGAGRRQHQVRTVAGRIEEQGVGGGRCRLSG